LSSPSIRPNQAAFYIVPKCPSGYQSTRPMNHGRTQSTVLASEDLRKAVKTYVECSGMCTNDSNYQVSVRVIKGREETDKFPRKGQDSLSILLSSS